MNIGHTALPGPRSRSVMMILPLANSKVNSYLSDNEDFSDDGDFGDELDDPEAPEPTAALSLVVSMMENADLSFADTFRLAQIALLRSENTLVKHLNELESKTEGNFIAQKEAMRSLSAYWSTISDAIEALTTVGLGETEYYLEQNP